MINKIKNGEAKILLIMLIMSKKTT
jgi:hypothetical protein